MIYFRLLYIIIFLFVPGLLFKAFPAIASFSDTRNTNWSNQYINELANKNIVKGFPDNTYKPDEDITRAEFAVILKKAFSLKEEDVNIKFSDDKEIPEWAYSSIYAVVNQYLILGDSENKFNPNDKIKRIELINILTLATGVDLLASETEVEPVLNIFRDKDQIPIWGRRNAASAVNENLIILHSNVNYLRPTDNAKRGEVAALTYLALEKLGKVKNLAIPDNTKIPGINKTKNPKIIIIIIIIILFLVLIFILP